MMPFYTFYQNNSGGNFTVNNTVAEYVIIEAEDSNDANNKAEEIGIYFDGVIAEIDCDCCGDRWYRQYREEGTKNPEIYGKSVREWMLSKKRHHLRNQVIVYWKNGRKRIYRCRSLPREGT
jgi:hypothetical protein